MAAVAVALDGAATRHGRAVVPRPDDVQLHLLELLDVDPTALLHSWRGGCP